VLSGLDGGAVYGMFVFAVVLAVLFGGLAYEAIQERNIDTEEE
jgi:hypothetical protein